MIAGCHFKWPLRSPSSYKGMPHCSHTVPSTLLTLYVTDIYECVQSDRPESMFDFKYITIPLFQRDVNYYSTWTHWQKELTHIHTLYMICLLKALMFNYSFFFLFIYSPAGSWWKYEALFWWALPYINQQFLTPNLCFEAWSTSTYCPIHVVGVASLWITVTVGKGFFFLYLMIPSKITLFVRFCCTINCIITQANMVFEKIEVLWKMKSRTQDLSNLWPNKFAQGAGLYFTAVLPPILWVRALLCVSIRQFVHLPWQLVSTFM